MTATATALHLPDDDGPSSTVAIARVTGGATETARHLGLDDWDAIATAPTRPAAGALVGQRDQSRSLQFVRHAPDRHRPGRGHNGCRARGATAAFRPRNRLGRSWQADGRCCPHA